MRWIGPHQNIPIQATFRIIHTKLEVDFQFSTRILEVQFQNALIRLFNTCRACPAFVELVTDVEKQCANCNI